MSERHEVTSSKALAKLVTGNDRFIQEEAEYPRQDKARRAEVAKQQQPFAAILTCADSRVSPEQVFDQGLGDLFVIRVAGNIVDDAVLGSIEYALFNLGINLVVIMGHQHCGAVTAAMSGKDTNFPGIDSIIRAIRPVVARANALEGDKTDNAIRLNAQNVAHELRDNNKLISELVQGSDIQIVSAYYNLENSRVEFLDSEA